MVLCPGRLCRKSPLGSFHFLMLSADADANVYSRGCMAIARTPFLWLVRVHIALPAARSHSFTVESIEPVTTCGSVACVMIDTTVAAWDDKQWTYDTHNAWR